MSAGNITGFMNVQIPSGDPKNLAQTVKGNTNGAASGNSPITAVSSRTAPVKQPSDAELREAVALLQQKAQTAAPNLQFSIDRDASRVVIKVTDSSTREVIRQFPPEEILHLDKELTRLQGLLFSKQA